MANNQLQMNTPSDNYDKEWVDLILDAKRAGISITEIRDFLALANANDRIPK